MDGFFNRSEMTDLRVAQKGTQISGAGGCKTCGLYQTVNSPKMKPTGKGELGVLIVAEAPGEKEDSQGMQLVGPAGKALRKALSKLGYDMDADCRKTNAICCRPPSSRTPTEREVACCRDWLFDEIEQHHPKVIIPLGITALEALIGDRWDGGLGGINRWRGWTIPDQVAGAWVCPTFHPSYVMRECAKLYSDGERDRNPSVAITFENDLAAAFGMLKKKLPTQVPKESMVTIDEKGDLAVERLHEIMAWYKEHATGPFDGGVPPIGFDFETTGLKPYRKGHRIVTCAVADRLDRSIAFPLTPKTQAALTPVLASKLIPKVAHNFKFEDQWSSVILKTQVAYWAWCSMTAAHIEDNRGGKDDKKDKGGEQTGSITSLRFQAAARLGVFGFKDASDEYLKDTADDQHGANSFNCIDDCPRDTLLLRNGMDALITLRLAIMQIAEAEQLEFELRRKSK